MKKNPIIVLLFVLIFASNHFAYSQDNNFAFTPGEWTGTWSGKLDIQTSDGKSSKVDMTLKISETENQGEWKWVTDYGGNLTKDYLLKTVDAEKGIYKLDESNSIVLNYFFSGNTFYSMFSVKENMLFTEYNLKNGEIYFEVISAPMHSPDISGKESDENGRIFSYPVYAVQKAVLKKE